MRNEYQFLTAEHRCRWSSLHNIDISSSARGIFRNSAYVNREKSLTCFLNIMTFLASNFIPVSYLGWMCCKSLSKKIFCATKIPCVAHLKSELAVKSNKPKCFRCFSIYRIVLHNSASSCYRAKEQRGQ